jgi:N-methylhydantoinase A
MTTPSVRLGADIGGTFTDVILVAADGAISTRKVFSDKEDYAASVVQATDSLLRDGAVEAERVGEVVHGTTVATNAILERAGARTGLLTTKGFRDVLELGRLRLPELYNLLYVKPAPLVERALRIGIPERMSAHGEVLAALDEASAIRAIDRLIDEGVESIAISLLNSWTNSAHELQLAELLAKRHPHVYRSVSSEVLAEIGEYERTSTTVINAYVQPIVGRYLARLSDGLAGLGITVPVYVMQSNGGLMSSRRAGELPAHIVESGPAAGVVAALDLATRQGVPNCIAFDMGGTSAKASVIEDGRMHITSDYEVGSQFSQWSWFLGGRGFALKTPAIDIAEVGAGGGSIVSIDRGGSLHVGPQSAGARPGPACYARGGELATVTDANVVLGYINPDAIAGGSVPIDSKKAGRVIDEQVAKPLGLRPDEASFAVHTVANSRMIGAIKAVTTRRGRDPRDFVLIAYGGNGPVHATGLAELLEIRRVLIPPIPGLFSALGVLLSNRQHDYIQSIYRGVNDLNFETVLSGFATMESRAQSELEADGLDGSAPSVRRLVDVRYAGQGYELTIPIPAGLTASQSLAELESAFTEEHRRTYGHVFEGGELELVNLRLSVIVPNNSDQLAAGRLASAPSVLKPIRDAFFPHKGRVSTPIIARHDLTEGPRSGPLIVEEYDATTVVPPSWTARLDGDQNIVLEMA